MKNFNLSSALFMFSVTLLSACSTHEEKKVDATTTGGTTDSSAAQTDAPAVKSAPLKSPLGKTYVLDDKIEYAIDSLKRSKSLGQMKKGRTATEGNDFYIVSFRARNTGAAPVVIDTNATTIKAVDDQNWNTAPAGEEAVTLNGGSHELFKSKLEPGQFKPFLAIFDLPSSAIETGAVFVIPSSKPDSKDRWVVELDNSKKKHH